MRSNPQLHIEWDALIQLPICAVLGPPLIRPRIDRRGKVRFLDDAEESRLRIALQSRDELMKKSRAAANLRHLKRAERLLPSLAHFGDHVTPAVLLSINTGLRRGELLNLRWSLIDFDRRLLTVDGCNAKRRQTRHVPLNEEATSLLRSWREQTGDGSRVFAVATNYKKGWKAILKRAGITQFRWHVMRHHFAPRGWCSAAYPQHRPRSARAQHGADVTALRASGAGPATRGRREAQRKADSCAYPALTVECLSGKRI